MTKPLTDRDLETLGELEAANRNLTEYSFRGGWARPMDCGGSNGSHHGATLAKLWRRNLVDRKGWKQRRAVNWYKINKAGRAALVLFNKARK
jgi:hypothetical protein